MSTFNVELFGKKFDLDKSYSEAVEFLAKEMRLHNSEENVVALEAFAEVCREMAVDSTYLYAGTWMSD